MRPENSKPTRPRDPRLYQIAVLGSLLLYGVLGLELEVQATNAVVMLIAAQAAQWTFTRLYDLPRFDPRSALISSLSLCLLLRTNSFELAALAAVVTIASKFLIRARGQHVFNPTNFGLAAMLLVFDGVWVSPGQWGSVALFGFLLAGLGALVVHRAERSDVTWAFLAVYGGLLFARAAWLGDPWEIPLHQLESGAFLIFAFFMISDPKTTPNTRPGRILYATLVASLAVVLRFGFYQPNALIWALVALAPTVPLIDRVLSAGQPSPNHSQPGAASAWRRRSETRQDLTRRRRRSQRRDAAEGKTAQRGPLRRPEGRGSVGLARP